MNFIVIKNRIEKLLNCLPGPNRGGGVLTNSEYENLKASGEPMIGGFLVVPDAMPEHKWLEEVQEMAVWQREKREEYYDKINIE